MKEFPTNFMEWMINKGFINEGQKETLLDMWEALIEASFIDKGVSTYHWMKQFGDNTKFNFILKKLGNAGYISSTVVYNYAELKLIVDNKSEEIKQNNIFNNKFQHYMLNYDKNSSANLTKTEFGYKNVGLVRRGFARASGMSFKLDTKYIEKYAQYIAKNIYQELSASVEDVKYSEIVEALLDYYTIEDIEYSIGKSISDSRGRNIPRCTKKIGNPISSKDIRACIKIEDKNLNYTAIRNIYAFISELNGYRGKNWYDKVKKGQDFYILRTMPSIEEMIEKNDFSDLHERIWLERIYENLDNIEKGWTVPLEIDATASMLQITAVLLNDHTYMDLTNLINPNEFKDAWTIEGVTREQVKKSVTPRLYGSSAEPAKLWAKNKIKYTQDNVNIITNEIRNGRYARANNFKDFIINNVQPKQKMKVRIWDEEFEIVCNKFKEDVVDTVEYTVYTTNQGQYRTAIITEEREADLKAFKRYFQTLLIHNLDSQVANYICESLELDWIIPNHDAFMVHPHDVETVRKLYTGKLMDMYKHRHEIIENYFKSIGITKKATFKEDSEIEEFSGYALK